MNLKKVKYLVYALAAAILAAGIAAYWLQSVALFVIVMGLCVAVLVVMLALWRCPYCGGLLGRDVSKFCTHCGKKLDDLE